MAFVVQALKVHNDWKSYGHSDGPSSGVLSFDLHVACKINFKPKMSATWPLGSPKPATLATSFKKVYNVVYTCV